MPPTLRGDQALALGALAADVKVVTGYPGSPATGVFDALLQAGADAPPHIQWAANEKVAMELAFGASLAGSRALVVLKSVGLNVALDPLATLSYTGCRAGLVVLLGDDPGGWGSQNEQDSRWLARVAEVPLVEPVSVEQSAALIAQAYAWSEATGAPVILRITRQFAAASAAVDEPWRLPPAPGRYARPHGPWVTYPPLVIKHHRLLHQRLRAMRGAFESSPYDLTRGDGPLGILAVGFSYTTLLDLLGQQPHLELSILGLSSAWPLPEQALTHWLGRRQRVLVLEEGGPFVEEQLRALAQRVAPGIAILGRNDRILPAEDELGPRDLAASLAALDPALVLPAAPSAQPTLLAEKPLCAGCLYWPVFSTLLETIEAHGGRARHLVVGEPGCMVHAMQAPLKLFDVKYSMGAGLGLGMGLALCEPTRHVIAILGDSSFLHTGLNALPQAVQLNQRLLVVILDNQTTGLTGGQPHMGSPTDERGQPRASLDLARVVAGLGIAPAVCDARNVAQLAALFDQALAADGLRVIITRAPCPLYVDPGEVLNNSSRPVTLSEAKGLL